ncbi:pyridoxamine 5'-phosphate oxidase family protein [Metabacillus sp. RGM 3146]|uniref:pyridoxamine 5'-phosphate oxidase family protein n=1 Tax=Metabacillus sp. RGM 3146 TaxID=3401092 RepID=UPI003B9B260A
MANKVETKLIEPLFNAFQKERIVTISTIDHETGAPHVTVISWVYAPDHEHLYAALDSRSRIVENIKKHPAAVINVFVNESAYSVIGHTYIKMEALNGIPLKLSLIELKISEVRDVMFYGSRIKVEPAYEKTYDEKAAAKLDQQVFDAMKKA